MGQVLVLKGGGIMINRTGIVMRIVEIKRGAIVEGDYRTCLRRLWERGQRDFGNTV